MLSILIIPGYKLFPMETGASVAQFAMIDELRKYMSLSLLTDIGNVPDAHIQELRTLWPEVTMFTWKELRSEWEESYAPGFLERVKTKLGFRPVRNGVPEYQFGSQLQDVWSNVSIIFKEVPEWRVESLKVHLSNHLYDIVQTDLPPNLPLLKPFKGQKFKTVHICHELKHKRFQNTVEMLGDHSNELEAAVTLLKEKEMGLISKYDACFLFNEDDALIVGEGAETKTAISPFPVLDSEFHDKERVRPIRLIFIGPESHGPNKEGLTWFVNEILPSVDDDWKLHVLGHWSDAKRKELGSEAVLFHGFVDDLQEFFHDSILVVPVRSGSGIRTKILQAMAQRVPVISTPFAAEGINTEGSIHYFENQKEFKSSLEAMLVDEQRTSRTERAHQIVKESFSQAVLGKKRYLLLKNLIENNSE